MGIYKIFTRLLLCDSAPSSLSGTFCSSREKGCSRFPWLSAKHMETVQVQIWWKRAEVVETASVEAYLLVLAKMTDVFSGRARSLSTVINNYCIFNSKQQEGVMWCAFRGWKYLEKLIYKGMQITATSETG